MESVILWCLHCNEAFCPTCYDSYPVYSFDEKTKSFKEIDCNDEEAFRIAHKKHKIIRLRVIRDSFCSNYSFMEPVRDDYVLATDGAKCYTVKRWRTKVDEPVKYQIIDCKLEFDKPVLKVQSRDLRRQMVCDAKMLNMDENGINEFINKYERFVSNISLKDVMECGYSIDDPTVSYASIKKEIMEAFFDACYSYFTDEKLKSLKVFIHEDSEYDDVMNIQIKRSFRLTSSNGGLFPGSEFPVTDFTN